LVIKKKSNIYTYFILFNYLADEFKQCSFYGKN